MFALLMGLKSVSPAELQRLLQDRHVTVIDVNSRQSWEKAHIPGALHFDPVAWSEADLPPDKQSSLVFYCSNPMCRKAPSAARRAKVMGYANVRVLSSGITGWLAAKMPVEGGA
ncbi:MAG TPA: rhodanese-like domain-containing protein [Xanthomonadaceae bacterium]|jgi:rhodanese-related sulfurtransferase|nr:rhodanese-like domain-containing protein [Xanthomonadaceae bacterium]